MWTQVGGRSGSDRTLRISLVEINAVGFSAITFWAENSQSREGKVKVKTKKILMKNFPETQSPCSKYVVLCITKCLNSSFLSIGRVRGAMK